MAVPRIKGEATVTVVGHYAPPKKLAEMEQELKYFVEMLKSKGHASLIVAGDFNRPLEQMQALAHSLRLTVAQSDYHATHINRESDLAETSQTDYILCSENWSNTRALSEFRSPSDHIPLLSEIELQKSQPKANKRKSMRLTLNKDLTGLQIK